MMVNFDWVIMTCVIAHEVCPTPSVRVVWSTTVKEIAVKNQCVSCSEKTTLHEMKNTSNLKNCLKSSKTIVKIMKDFIIYLAIYKFKFSFHIIIFKTCSIYEILKRNNLTLRVYTLKDINDTAFKTNTKKVLTMSLGKG